MKQSQRLKPWMSGPLELLQHAEGHLRGATDFDRRMALISFDNAIEIAISSFLDLHPDQRGGQNFKREDKQKWLHNYHSKIEFLEEFSIQKGQPLSVQQDEIIFYHKLRNLLYHSGNGVVPEQKHVTGARQVALAVFELLYGVNAEEILNNQGLIEPIMSVRLDVEKDSGHMHLLQAVIDFENCLRGTLEAMGIQEELTSEHIGELWELFYSSSKSSRPEQDWTVNRVLTQRYEILLTDEIFASDEELHESAKKLGQITKFIKQYVHSKDLLPDLNRQSYAKYLKPDLQSVYIEIDGGFVWLKWSQRFAGEPNKLIQNSEILNYKDFSDEISPDLTEISFPFSIKLSAEDNGRLILDDVDLGEQVLKMGPLESD